MNVSDPADFVERQPGKIRMVTWFCRTARQRGNQQTRVGTTNQERSLGGILGIFIVRVAQDEQPAAKDTIDVEAGEVGDCKRQEAEFLSLRYLGTHR